MFLSLICGSPVVHSVIVKRRAYITLRDGWVSVQLTFLLSLSSPLSIQHHHHCQQAFLSSELCAFSSACSLEPCAVRGAEVNPFHPLRYYVAEARDHIGS